MSRLSAGRALVAATALAAALLAAGPDGWGLMPGADTRAVAATGAALTVVAVAGLAGLTRRLLRAAPTGRVVVLALVLPGLVGVTAAGAAPAATDARGATSAPASPDGRSAREGRAFLEAPRGAPGAGRIYVDLSAAATVRERVDDAVAAWAADGGRDRGTVLVAVPTGSGWVDAAAVAAAERVLDGDVTTVVVPYAQRPSWLETLLGGTRAEDVTAALVAALRTELDAVPAARRPRLAVFGESLGARAALAVAERLDVDACLAAGTPVLPADAPPPGGRSGGCRSVANADDPVARWSPALLVRPPAGERAAHGWLPVVTFWQASAEMLVSLDQPEGHGHRYGGALEPAWQEVLTAPAG